MMWVRPNEAHLAEIVQQAKGSLLVCSPYISRWGLERVESSIPATLRQIEVWTKLDSGDWLSGASDPEALLEFAERERARVENFRLRTSDSLHAKFVLADNDRALAGSANLTHSGFVGNIELVRLFDGSEVAQFLAFVQKVRQELSLSSIDALKDFVTTCNNRAADKEALIDLIREVAPPQVAVGTGLIALTDFITYVRRIGGRLADEILRIYTNADGNNRTGHLKQAFYGVQRFFQEYSHAIQQVVGLTTVAVPFELQDTDLVASWVRFISDFGQERNALYQYDFSVLRGYLTPQFGGNRTGGGGGDYPFKLVWPHLARQMQSP